MCCRGGSVSNDLLSLELWNSRSLWRGLYGNLADGLVFFAEDAFGGQFALASDHVVVFDPETGATKRIASSLEEWADAILADVGLHRGSFLARQWQEQHRPLRSGERLLPKTPFVLGGAFAVENLYPADAVDGMRLRGELATQLRDFPEGDVGQFQDC